jgi:hypothetical protein
MSRSLSRLLWLALAALPAFAWGPAGHQVVALIAEQRLSPDVRARITKLLFDGQYSMSQISTCADALRAADRGPLKPEDEFCAKLVSNNIPSGTGPWHYIDIPVPTTEKSLDAFCPDGACVVGKIKAFRETLSNSTSDDDRRTALLFLIHFMGDIHQPLHCAERQCDQGGNQEHVAFHMKGVERGDLRLHGVWDVDLVDKLMQDEKTTDLSTLATKLLKKVQESQAAAWVQTSVDEIAWEGYALAEKHAYKGIPAQNFCDKSTPPPVAPPFALSSGYEDEGERIVRVQLMKAGVRLAALLQNSLEK